MSGIKYFGSTIRIFGVCLGHQAIGQAYGGLIIRAKQPRHGKSSMIEHVRESIFHGVENPLQVAHYHSLIVCKETLPNELLVTAYSKEGEIMALRHRSYPVFGVQFHPESVITKSGYKLLHNFMEI